MKGEVDMKIDSPEAYIDSLRKLERRIFVMGERADNPTDHPMIRPSINAVAETYNLGDEPEAEGLLFVQSHLTGERTSRFTHIHQSTDDLVNRCSCSACWASARPRVSSAVWAWTASTPYTR